MVTRLQLERWQVLVYLTAIAGGACWGGQAPAAGPVMERWLWPALAALLYVTFAQVPVVELRDALCHRPFLSALLAGNFVVVPVVVWALTHLLPYDPAIRLGVSLVLLVPCTDWFVSFTLLGRGDARLATAATPVLLLTQLVLLPVYLAWFWGRQLAAVVQPVVFLKAFGLVVLLPLALAALTEWAARPTVTPHPRRWQRLRSKWASRWLAATAWGPVPLLAVVIGLIAGSQVRAVAGAVPVLGTVAGVFGLYAAVTPWLARWVARRFGLGVPAQRTVVFSLGTRNSFVVLPLALTLPSGWELTVAVIVLQSLVELGAMLVYLRWVPNWLIAEPARRCG